MGARKRVGIGLSCLPDRLHRQAESMPWNRSLGSLKVLKIPFLYSKHPNYTTKILNYRLHRLAGRYDNPILPESTISHSGDYEFGYWSTDRIGVE
jgi:hypothetical protein